MLHNLDCQQQKMYHDAIKSYAQACGVARALDLVGERWTLLVIRELILGPKRFTDLAEGLPGISSSLLGARLREMERVGVVARRRLPPPAASMVYELTPSGKALEEPLRALARWGARFGRERAPSDISRPEWHLLALRAMFRPEAARDLEATYEFRFEDGLVTARIEHGKLRLDWGPAEDPSLTISTDHATFFGVASGRSNTDEAIESGALTIDGDATASRQLFEIFNARADSVEVA